MGRSRLREAQVVALLLEGYEIKDIARQLGMAYRTVKVHFTRVYNRLGIVEGDKHVKLAAWLCRQVLQEAPNSMNGSGVSLDWLQMVLRTRTLPVSWARPSMWSKTTSEASTIV